MPTESFVVIVLIKRFAGFSSIRNRLVPGCFGPEVIKLLSCSTKLSLKNFLLINVKMPTIVGILTFMRGKNSIVGLSEPKKPEFLDIFI